jgi:hypothetical protein
MGEPTRSSWLMEELLVPWTHYLPVRADWSDLEEKVEWCIVNAAKCERIGVEGQCWMRQFLDLEKEREVMAAVFRAAGEAQREAGMCES